MQRKIKLIYIKKFLINIFDILLKLIKLCNISIYLLHYKIF